MTPRERLLAVLEGKPVDRIPTWLLFPYHATGYYVDVRSHPAYRPLFERSCEQAVHLNRRNLGVPLYTPDVTWENERIEEDGWTITRRRLLYRDESIQSETRVRDGEQKVTKLLADEEDLEFFCRLPVETDPQRIAAALDEQLPTYRRECEEFPLDLGAMMLDLGEPVGPLYHNADLEEYAIWSLTHDATVTDFLDSVMEQKRLVYRWCLERELADVYFLVGSELAAPPLVSRDTFQRWIVPYAKELIEMIHAHGKKAIQHFHGQIRDILPDFVIMNPDGLHTIEAPPVGNCTLTQAFDAVGDAITLIGNIQYDDFRSFTAEQMRDAVQAVLEEARGKRFILSPTAGPFDDAPPARLLENYRVFLDTGWAAQ